MEPLLQRLQAQTVHADEIIVVDSESSDGTVELADRMGARVIRILKKNFDHGGTRDEALRQSTGELVLFLTQDALPADEHYIERLIHPFSDSAVAAVTGRQIARREARPFEKAVRAFSYPPTSRIWDASAIPTDGIRAFLLSDVCSAYRRSFYEAAGGFAHSLLTNEDMLMAACLLDIGCKLAYAGDAAVYHSHRYTLGQEYRRNYTIGRFMQRYSHKLHNAKETGRGLKLVQYVLGQLWREKEWLEIPAFCFNCAARLLGNRMGRSFERRTRRHAESGNSAGSL